MYLNHNNCINISVKNDKNSHDLSRDIVSFTVGIDGLVVTLFVIDIVSLTIGKGGLGFGFSNIKLTSDV